MATRKSDCGASSPCYDGVSEARNVNGRRALQEMDVKQAAGGGGAGDSPAMGTAFDLSLVESRACPARPAERVHADVTVEAAISKSQREKNGSPGYSEMCEC